MFSSAVTYMLETSLKTILFSGIFEHKTITNQVPILERFLSL